MPYGDRFRKHRRLMSQVLNSQAVVAYRELQTNSTKGLLKSLLDSPERFDHHILRFVFADSFRCSNRHSSFHSQTYTTLMRMTYGISVVSDDDVLVAMIGETLNRVVSEGPPGTCMIDLFPFREFSVQRYILQNLKSKNPKSSTYRLGFQAQTIRIALK